MRVGLDVSPLDQTRAGTARYIEGIDALDGIELVRLCHRGSGRIATVYRDAWWYPVVLPRLAKRERLDVLHCPTFRGPISPPPMPLVVTVHDLAVLRHPETFNQWTRRYSRSCVPRVARAASRIIAVSEFTKRELVELLGTPPGKVTVIPNGVAEVFSPDGPAAEGDYVLAVGTLEPRKNLERVAGGGASGRRRAASRRRARLGWRAGGGLAGPGLRRRARASLPGREVRRLRVAVRGLRPADRRGDGLRHAGRDEPRRRDRGDGRRRRRARRSVRPGGDRCRHRGSGRATRRAAPARPRACPRLLVGRGGARYG